MIALALMFAGASACLGDLEPGNPSTPDASVADAPDKPDPGTPKTPRELFDTTVKQAVKDKCGVCHETLIKPFLPKELDKYYDELVKRDDIIKKFDATTAPLVKYVHTGTGPKPTWEDKNHEKAIIAWMEAEAKAAAGK